MAKGFFVAHKGKLFKVTTPMMKVLLKDRIRGAEVIVDPEKEVGEVTNIDGLTPEQATAKFMAIEMAAGKEE